MSGADASLAPEQHRCGGIVLTYPEILERWATQQSSVVGEIVIRFRRGSEDWQVRSAEVGLESTARLGVVAVWDSGAVEAEVIDISSSTRLFVASTQVANESELVAVLDEAWNAMRNRPREATE